MAGVLEGRFGRMTYLTVRVRSTGLVVGERVRLANGPWQRFLGLMGTSNLPPGSGMLFPKTNAVHGFFMHYSVRLAYLDRRGTVLKVAVLRPWRVGPIVRSARFVLELPDSPSSEIVHPGDRLTWEITEASARDAGGS